MVASFPSNADSAQLATDGYSEVILLDGTQTTSASSVNYSNFEFAVYDSSNKAATLTVPEISGNDFTTFTKSGTGWTDATVYLTEATDTPIADNADEKYYLEAYVATDTYTLFGIDWNSTTRVTANYVGSTATSSGNYFSGPANAVSWYTSAGNNNSVSYTATTALLAMAFNKSTGAFYFGYADVAGGATSITWHQSKDPATDTTGGLITSLTGTEGQYFLPGVSTYTTGGITHINPGQDATFNGALSPSTTYTDSAGAGSFYFRPPAGYYAYSTSYDSTYVPGVTTDDIVWTVPDGVDSLSIVAIGPGGGSGGSNGTNAGGGGGGGGLSWINNVVVSEGSTITMLGGIGGSGADSGNASGDSGTAVTVSINVLAAERDYSSVDLNPYNNVIISSDSASGILTVRSGKGTDSDVLSPFGKLESYDGGSLQTKFDIYNNTKNSFDLNFNVQPYVEYDSSVLPLSYPSWSGGAPGGMNDSDAYPNLYVDSNRYENEDTVLGTIDTIDVGSGRLTLFGIFTNDVGTALQATISNSPYLDSNGNSTVGATDPNDVRGYGPTGEAESIQIIVRSRAGDTISSV